MPKNIISVYVALNEDAKMVSDMDDYTKIDIDDEDGMKELKQELGIEFYDDEYEDE